MRIGYVRSRLSVRGCHCGHRTQGCIAQWLEQLTADQQVPGSIPAGGHGLPSRLPRKSVNMVAELDLWIPDTTERQEDYSVVAKATTATAVALDTKARAALGTVVQLKSEFAQSQQSRTEAVTQVDSLSLTALNPPSDFGADTVVDRIPGRLTGESLDRLGNPTFSMTLQNQEQPIRLDEDQSTTDTTDLEMTEKTLAEDTAAFEDITQDCLVCQIKVADFEAYNKSLSEELKVLAKGRP